MPSNNAPAVCPAMALDAAFQWPQPPDATLCQTETMPAATTANMNQNINWHVIFVTYRHLVIMIATAIKARPSGDTAIKGDRHQQRHGNQRHEGGHRYQEGIKGNTAIKEDTAIKGTGIKRTWL